MKADTHRIEKNTAKAAEGYVRLRLEQRIKELENENANLKRELSAAMRELLEERKVKLCGPSLCRWKPWLSSGVLRARVGVST